jgi:hypothetical protein
MQGGRGVKIAGTSVVALEFVNKVGLGSTHRLELADHYGADNHRAISMLLVRHWVTVLLRLSRF